MKLSNRVFIGGITFVPPFMIGIAGSFDAKRSAVRLTNDGWRSHYLEIKSETLTKYINSVYLALEEAVKPLYSRSGELVTRIDILEDSIYECEAIINAGFSDRLSERRVKIATKAISENTGELHNCITELSSIDSQITSCLILAKGKAAKAIAACSKHVQRYLLAASRKLRHVEVTTSYDVVLHIGFTIEERFNDEHRRADNERHNIITQRHTEF